MAWGQNYEFWDSKMCSNRFLYLFKYSLKGSSYNSYIFKVFTFWIFISWLEDDSGVVYSF